MRVMIWGDPRPLDHPMGRIHSDLAAMPDIDVVTERLAAIPKEPYDVLLTWNGLHAGRDRLVPKLREQGKPVVVVERGFFDRMNHSQVDHEGFNHNASWAKRFPKVSEPHPLKARKHGYVLALLQKANDTQLWDAPFRSPAPFLESLSKAVPNRIDLFVRQHPKQAFDCPGLTRGTLRSDLADARFFVTINSNASNDAIALGCPVLCVGPSVAGYSGAALYSPPEHLGIAIEAMLDGWVPWRADEYCAWLSTKQHSLNDIGAATRTALEKALND